MKRFGLTLVLATATFYLYACEPSKGTPVAEDSGEPNAEIVKRLAQCITEKGIVMYGTSSCSGCRAQRKAFGSAWELIDYVECDPHEEGSQVDRCLERNIRKTPTWIQEIDGKEVKRLEMYQLLEDLAEFAECEFGSAL